MKLFLPSEGLYTDTTFTRVEWPNLMPPANTAVAKIDWVDHTNPSNVKVLWSTGDSTIFPMNKPVSQWAAEKLARDVLVERTWIGAVRK